MKLRVEVVWESDAGEEQRASMMAIDRPQLAMETLGLNLSESKAMLEGVQDIVVASPGTRESVSARTTRRNKPFEEIRVMTQCLSGLGLLLSKTAEHLLRLESGEDSGDVRRCVVELEA